MTNDGELANILMHPSTMVDKTYEVKVKGRISDTILQNLADGVPLEDGMTAPADVYYVGFDSKSGLTTIEITIHEGKKPPGTPHDRAFWLSGAQFAPRPVRLLDPERRQARLVPQPEA